MITTPCPPGSPDRDPFFGGFTTGPSTTLSDEPTPFSTRGGTLSVPQTNGVPEHRTKNQAPKGLHMLQNLQNLDDKLKKEKAAADLEDKIAAEFDDHFVSQVYNYLSLGYPATARQYDEELSKISRISVEELQRDDGAIMEALWGTAPNGDDGDADKKKKARAAGHIMLDSEAKDGVREEDRCPRWKALKLYIYEWAHQHPDLNAISPLAWGVQERRGSWGI
jgi:hypothetical protein